MKKAFALLVEFKDPKNSNIETLLNIPFNVLIAKEFKTGVVLLQAKARSPLRLIFIHFPEEYTYDLIRLQEKISSPSISRLWTDLREVISMLIWEMYRDTRLGLHRCPILERPVI